MYCNFPAPYLDLTLSLVGWKYCSKVTIWPENQP